MKSEEKLQIIQRTCGTYGLAWHSLALHTWIKLLTDIFENYVWYGCLSALKIFREQIFLRVCVFYHSLHCLSVLLIFSLHHSFHSSSKSIISQNIYSFNFYYMFCTCVGMCVQFEMPSVYFEHREFYLLYSKLISISK